MDQTNKHNNTVHWHGECNVSMNFYFHKPFPPSYKDINDINKLSPLTLPPNTWKKKKKTVICFYRNISPKETQKLFRRLCCSKGNIKTTKFELNLPTLHSSFTFNVGLNLTSSCYYKI